MRNNVEQDEFGYNGLAAPMGQTDGVGGRIWLAGGSGGLLRMV